MKDINTNIGVSVKYGKINMIEKKLNGINQPYKKQTTKEMFEKITNFFFKNLCNCKK